MQCRFDVQVANREHKRLKKSSEHHPGYAMSKAYLETLADLPWSQFSGQAGLGQSGANNSSQPTSEGMVALPCVKAYFTICLRAVKVLLTYAVH